MTMDDGGLGIVGLADLQEVRHDARSVLYAATDVKLDRRVAVRRFGTIGGGADRDRFRHETMVIGRLSSHPGVVTVYDAGVTDHGVPYLVTELVNGPTLADVAAQRGPLQWQQAADLCLQLCAPLEAAHRAGVIHRDLRPETIVLSGQAPKLDGFALTVSDRGPDQMAGPSPAGDPTLDLHRAPETYGGVWDERSDLYSLASILYQLIAGRAPMWRPDPDTSEALAYRIANQPPVELSPDAVPTALNVFITAALSKDPLDRPQTASEFAGELRLIRDGRTTGSNPSVLHATTSVGSIPPVAAADRTALIEPIAPAAPSQPAAAMSGGTATMAISAPADDLTQIATGPIAPGWSPPTDWSPPPGGGDPMPARDPMAPVPPGEIPLPPPVEEAPRRSPMFLAAVGLLAVTMVGLLAVIAMSALGSDDPQTAAPALPDPDAPTVIQADGSAGLTTTAVPGDGAMDDSASTVEAMEDAPPPAEAMEETTTTTVGRVEIPRLIGLSVEEATRILTDQGFEVLVVGRRTANAQPGTVTQQKPDPGNLVTLPISVTLYIPKASNLPTMVGRSADAVCLELEALGLVCNRVNQNHDQFPAGSVIATNPVEGSLFSEGSSVALTVSTGPVTDITVPDVAGRTRAEAETILREAGFTTIAFAMRPNGAPKDRVFGSNPEAGGILPSNRPITILISTGENSAITVADVIGLSQADATARLEGDGLSVAVTMIDLPAGDQQIGQVISTDPGVGAELAAGATVTIRVGQEGPETTTTTAEAPDGDTPGEDMPEDMTTTTMPADDMAEDMTTTTAAP
ncbi:MAG: PASTA domain-containing protein [Actinomycetota bacterium]